MRLKGEPFVGRGGQLLTQLIEGIGLTRDDVYIAKNRPADGWKSGYRGSQ
jgi:uracil-DNA glycosylase family 4